MVTRLELETKIAKTTADRDRHIAGLKSGSAMALSNSSLLNTDLATLAALQAELAAWVEPVPVRTLLGASALTGGMSAAAAQRILDRWGVGGTVRLFSQSGWTVFTPINGVGAWQLSWKPTLGVPLDRVAARAALRSVPAGAKVCVWHESDVKTRKGADAAPMIAIHREFAAFIREERPDLVLMGVMSGWTFTPTKNYVPEDYIDPTTFDVLALDLDGIVDSYADFLPMVAKAQAWMQQVGITRWTVAEFGAPRQASDTAGSVRAAWMTEQVTALKKLANPPEEISLFESGSYLNTELIAQVEIDAWKALTA